MKRENLDTNEGGVREPVASAGETLPPIVNQAPLAPTIDQPRNRAPHSIHPDKRRRSGGASVGIIVCLIIALLTGVIGFTLGTRMQNLSATQLDYSILNEVYNVLQSKYDGQLNKEALLDGAVKGLVAGAGDIYTEYMTAEEYSNLEVELSGEFYGVGVEIGLNGDGQLSIISTLDDSPARAAGLQAGDLIYTINGEDATGWSTSYAVSKIRGDLGTKVKISVIRDGEKKEFEIERAKIENPSVTWEIDDDGIGYMRISTFGDDTAGLAEQAAKEFIDKGVKGIVLDLRSNTGGYVDAAQAVASLWLNRGETITEERSGNKTIASIKATGGNILKDIPTVVLIDGATASASEITAGALRDNAGAELVGYQSYGKGLVQEVVSLSNGDVVKVTIAKWYTPNGDNINGEGLKPDEEVEMTAEQYNSGDDTQLERAKEILLVKTNIIMDGQKKKILLVEDDDTLAEVYRQRLELEGFDVARSNNGEAALKDAVEYHPDLILLDVMMPNLNGFDVLDILRNTPQTRNVHIIMLTALSQPKDAERAKELGADDFLVKSQVVIGDVVARIKHQLNML